MFHSKPYNPFEEPSLPRAFYHPSLEKDISEKEREICLSSDNKATKSSEGVQSKKDLSFVRKSNQFSSHDQVPTHEDGTMHQESSGSQFDESWPSTDKTVSISSKIISPGTNVDSTDPTMIQSDHKISSTLSKYIERFRHGAPASRDDRRSATSKDFWWLSPPSSSSTPKETTCDTSSLLSSDVSPNKRRIMSKKKSVTQSRPLRNIVEEKDNLQTRTEMLLEQSEHTLSGVSTPESLPKRPSSWMIEKLKRHEPVQESTRPVQLAPEDDILYQWRLARKLETAQEQVKSDQLKTASKFVTNARTMSLYCQTDIGITKKTTSSTGYTDIANNAESQDIPKPEKPREIIDASCQTNFTTELDKVERTKKRMRSTKSSSVVKDNGSQISLVALEPATSLEMVNVTESENTKTSSEDATVLNKCHNKVATVETGCSSKNTAIVTDVPGVCFVGESNLPRHVHMMCDIVPCTQQQASNTKEGTANTRETTSKKCGPPVVGKPFANVINETSQNRVIQQEQELVQNDSERLSYDNEMDGMIGETDNGKLIGDVIGQVISERLFSSVDIESPTRSSSDDEIIDEKTVSEFHSNSPSENIRDTEEFNDDRILFRLQRQANFYENHIRNIDQILQQMKD